jgi:hypothetical protein
LILASSNVLHVGDIEAGNCVVLIDGLIHTDEILLCHCRAKRYLH